METVWVLVVILSGSPSVNTENLAVDGFLGIEVENKTTMYFESEEACRDVLHATVVASPSMSERFESSSLRLEPCKAVEMEVVDEDGSDQEGND